MATRKIVPESTKIKLAGSYMTGRFTLKQLSVKYDISISVVSSILTLYLSREERTEKKLQIKY